MKQPPAPGDANDDTTVTLMNAVRTLKAVAGNMSDGQVSKAADINKDQNVGLSEVVFILRNLAHYRG